MLDPIRKLLSEAGKAKQTRAFWQAATRILSDWAGGARVELTYKGLTESGSVEAGAARTDGERFLTDFHDADGRHVSARFQGLPDGFPVDALRSTIEIATHLAVMVARRAGLERERRLGTFLVELSRWLLAAPERELLLRYTLQSVTSLVEAHGAYVALRAAEPALLRVAATVGQCVELDGAQITIDSSATGRVIRTGEPFLTDNILSEPDAQRSLSPSSTARAAMIAPLRTSSGVVGAVGVVRYHQPGADAPPPFGLMELQYLTAVAAYIAGGLELSEAVSGARAAAERAHAMVDGSPLPMALVGRDGRVQQLNQAGCRLLGIASESQALGIHLEALGLSPSEISLHLVLARPRDDSPWHGRVLVTQPSGDRRICDCTVTGLAGVAPDSLLVALYDRTEELRAQRELIAREKLATVGEIASGVAHEVNNPLAAIRMEAELLGRASRDPETSTSAATITREVDRAARIVRSLLRLARRADTAPTRVQINDLVHDVAEIRRRVLRAESVEFRTELDQSAPAVLGLGQELQQVVINLVTNAEHVVRGRHPAIIRLRTQAREGWVRLTVDDSGPGVPKDIRGRVFDPFFTTKSPDEGTGLGLAICQRVVTEVGGKIWIEDSEFGGATFVVELPAAPAHVETRTVG
ncbi:MAG TPA: ATP-binding protein [Gemmatimonadales bacterium]|nr:ATP-binding protein [Gemmatimonadales bacterium]